MLQGSTVTRHVLQQDNPAASGHRDSQQLSSLRVLEQDVKSVEASVMLFRLFRKLTVMTISVQISEIQQDINIIYYQ